MVCTLCMNTSDVLAEGKRASASSLLRTRTQSLKMSEQSSKAVCAVGTAILQKSLTSLRVTALLVISSPLSLAAPIIMKGKEGSRVYMAAIRPVSWS